MTKKEIVTEIMEFFMKDKLFLCPESNIIQDHNKKIFDLFNKYLEEQEDWPVLEDTVPWTESSIIDDTYENEDNDY